MHVLAKLSPVFQRLTLSSFPRAIAVSPQTSHTYLFPNGLGKQIYAKLASNPNVCIFLQCL